MLKASRYALGLFLILLPALLQAGFQMANKEIPVSDAGDHFRVAFLTYLRFSKNLLHGIHFVLHSGGKPILFSTFAAPFIPLFQFGARLPDIVFLSLVQAGTAVGYFLLFRARLGVVISGLLAAVICTAPYLFSLDTQFMPETLWHAWFVWSLVMLQRADDLERPRATCWAGVFLGLTVLARPVEGLVLLGPPLLVYALWLRNQGKTTIQSVLLHGSVCGIALLGCSLLDYFGGPKWLGWTLLAAMTLLHREAGMAYVTQRIGLKRLEPTPARIGRLLMPVTLLLGIWFLYYARDIYIWAYSNSFGEAAKINDQVNASRSMIEIFYVLLKEYGIMLPVASMALAALLAAVAKHTAPERRQLAYIAAGLLAMLLPMLLAYAVSGTSDPRRILLGLIFLHIVLLYYVGWAASRTIILRWMVPVLLVAMLVVQSMSILTAIFQTPWLSVQKGRFEQVVGVLPYRYPGPTESHDTEVVRALHDMGLHDTSFAVFSLGLFSKHMYYQVESLRYATLDIDPSLGFGTMWAYTKYEPYMAVVKRMRAVDFHYVLLDELENPLEGTPLQDQLQSHTFFVTDLLKLIREKGIQNIPGLRYVGSFMIADRKQDVFAVYDPSEPTFTLSSQLKPDLGWNGLWAGSNPGWHAAQPLSFPQTVTMDFARSKSFRTIALLPQDNGLFRMPKDYNVNTSVDGKHWKNVQHFTSDCHAKSTDDWQKQNFTTPLQTRYVQLEITSNCGDTGLMTLRGIKLE